MVCQMRAFLPQVASQLPRGGEKNHPGAITWRVEAKEPGYLLHRTVPFVPHLEACFRREFAEEYHPLAGRSSVWQLVGAACDYSAGDKQHRQVKTEA